MKNKSWIFLVLSIVLLVGVVAVTTTGLYRVNSGTTTSITVGAECQKVTNSISGKDILVPTGSSSEWTNFKTNKPAGVSLSACCTYGWHSNGLEPITNLEDTKFFGVPVPDSQVVLTPGTTLLPYGASWDRATSVTGNNAVPSFFGGVSRVPLTSGEDCVYMSPEGAWCPADFVGVHPNCIYVDRYCRRLDLPVIRGDTSWSTYDGSPSQNVYNVWMNNLVFANYINPYLPKCPGIIYPWNPENNRYHCRSEQYSVYRAEKFVWDCR